MSLKCPEYSIDKLVAEFRPDVRKRPFKNVKDVLELTRSAFAKISPDVVCDCYRHVEEQEAWYRRLHKVEPSIEEKSNNIPENSSLDSDMNEATLAEGNITFDSKGKMLLPMESEYEEIEALVEQHSLVCTLCGYEAVSTEYLGHHLKSHHQCHICNKECSGKQSLRN